MDSDASDERNEEINNSDSTQTEGESVNEVLKRIGYGFYNTVEPTKNLKRRTWGYFSLVHHINNDKILNFVQC